jgi:hypothetical protein
VNNYISGDQFNMYGDHSIGKIEQRTGPTSHTMSVNELQAMGELKEFIARLERMNLLSPSGTLSEKAVTAEIANQKSKLQKVRGVIASGATQVLSSALDHLATPIILKLIETHFFGTS